ncbi:hypothetical protein SDRG_10414 [Saprolegnia diclina VS20]|uniref:Uncharacterized protein n=1 Tax=Saprolegnia diclina (strain VS20) TaxID=1156394 RepID=T0QB64_SAPDV|nr:hypothetical protein SDRG_10414 [Saprolegnia diclina VS20]EQC31896.1 hypothetical protein SDRG_10414 [Saprolegnia diclina VS20]|eukprot:XP_008614624.1 hypothetical protein SDRG_10414 [Saprolegnia diclina VS20]
MSDDGHEYSPYSIARDVALPHCCLRKADAESSVTAELGGITVASWPLSTETVAALTTKYSGRIPAQDVTISGLGIAENEYFSESDILSNFDPYPDGDEFGMTFSMSLAHVAIDATGDASTFKPATQRPPRYTFATVVYFFPSNCVGGAVTISHGHRTTTYEALDAPITSGHRSFAVYHAVYDLADFDYAVKPRYAPPPLPSLQELQLAARRFEPDGHNSVMIRLATRSATPTFGPLTGPDKAILDLLLAADVFDIAIR